MIFEFIRITKKNDVESDEWRDRMTNTFEEDRRIWEFCD